MTIAERILKLRKQAGLSQEVFAEKLGVSRQSVSKWESGNVMPDLDKVVAMCELFGVTTDYLLKGKLEEETAQLPAEEKADYEEIYVGRPTDIPPEETAEAEEVEEEQEEKEEDSKPDEPTTKTKVKVIAGILAVLLILGVLIPIPTGAYKKLFAKINEEPVTYPYVLVHGMGGWGESAGINSLAPYWGASTGSLSNYLRGENVKVYEATVGPFSSAWDRACELYAQLTGTTVDYGAAHSAEHGHDRYGKTYTSPLYENWGKKTEGGQVQKINLIGHSFGGNTVRLLASLMEYGSEAEQQASSDNVSPLFKGGNGSYINSVTTLCSPHNGSTLYYVVDKQKLIPTALGMLQFAGGITNILDSGLIDFQLEHFGIFSDSANAMTLINDSFMNGKDNAFYDLSPHGAIELNQTIKTVNDIYYFSFAYCTTEKAPLTGMQTPRISTMLVLMPIARLIGTYTNTSADAPVKIDETWLPNDGLVNVISAQKPTNEPSADYVAGNEIERGKWYVFPTLTGDHGTVIGMGGNAEQTRKFYTDHIALIDSLPRTN